MKTYALAGYPLEHSFSAGYFNSKFTKDRIDARYVNLELPTISGIRKILSDCGIAGLNVTIPHKQAIIQHLDDVTEEAMAIGAVNCIQVVGSKLIGHNTDALGFEQSLKNSINRTPKDALIFGDGGSARAVKYALSHMDIPFRIVSRSGELNYDNLSESDVRQSELLINCTPLGMFPNIEIYPDIPYHAVTPDHFAFDLVYNPDETQFLNRVKNQGGSIKNGLEMLRLQAEASWAIWTS